MAEARILVVEDDPSIASGLERALTAEHYTVDIARTGEEALRLAELLARLRAHLRRFDGVPERVTIGPLEVDAGARRAWFDGNALELRAKEFDLLSALVANAGRVMRRDELMRDVWDENYFGSTKTLDVHMAALRRKLGNDQVGPGSITTLRGVGYRLERS